MASRTFPGIGLIGGWVASEGGWGSDMNSNLMSLSILTQLRALSVVDTHPVSPNNGDIHLCSDAFTDHEGEILYRDDGEWKYLEAVDGWEAYVVDTSSRYRFDGTDWVLRTAATVPEYTISDVGYVLRVAADGESLEWGAEFDPEYTIPSYTAANEGNSLTVLLDVENNPYLAWQVGPTTLPTITSGDYGKRLVARDTGYELEDDVSVKSVVPSYVMTSDDLIGGVVINASGNISIPSGLTRGSVVTIIRATPTAVEITPGSGVTLNSANGRRKLRAQWSSASLIKTGTNSYVLAGDLVL